MQFYQLILEQVELKLPPGEMICRMYLRYLELNNFKVNLDVDGDEAGIKIAHIYQR